MTRRTQPPFTTRISRNSTATKAAFTKIGRERLGRYLHLDGMWIPSFYAGPGLNNTGIGTELDTYVSSLGWSIDSATGVVTVPLNPDNRIEGQVVRENIQLPREFPFLKMKFEMAFC